jgi:hypothetical protein
MESKLMKRAISHGKTVKEQPIQAGLGRGEIYFDDYFTGTTLLRVEPRQGKS